MTTAPVEDRLLLRDQVVATESAFAKAMADRSIAAFEAHLSDEAVFLSGLSAARGKTEILERWRTYFAGARAPFSWQPERVEVLESGTLALSSGPVFDANGKRIATFSSIWRRESPGIWRIVFDAGCDACNCTASQ